MVEEIDFKNRTISNFQGDLDLDLGSGHMTYRHPSLIDLYITPNFIRIGRTFCGQMNGHIDDRQTSRPALLSQLRGVDQKNATVLNEIKGSKVWLIKVKSICTTASFITCALKIHISYLSTAGFSIRIQVCGSREEQVEEVKS